MDDSKSGLGASPGSRRDFVKSSLLGGAALLATSVPSFGAAPMTMSPAATAARAPYADLEALRAHDPALYAVAQDILSELKLTFAAAAATPGARTGNTFADDARTFIASRKPQKRARYAAAANQLLTAPEAARQQHFGRYANVAPTMVLSPDTAPLAKRAGIPRLPFAIVTAKLSNFTTSGTTILSDELEQALADAAAEAERKKKEAADITAGRRFTHLECMIHEVRCIRDNGDSGGVDEIALGGSFIGASGNFRHAKSFLVSEGFGSDSGEMHKFTYDIPWHFGWYQVNQHDTFPHYYSAEIGMAELDGGGFSDFITAIWKKVAVALGEAIGDLAGAAVAAAIGSFIPGLGTLIGALLGAFFAWLIDAFTNNDDIIATNYANIHVYSLKKSRYDAFGMTSKKGHVSTLEFKNKDEGHYQVDIGWKVYDEAGYKQRRDILKLQAGWYAAMEDETQ